MTLASVLIPTFDHASTLGFAVESVLAQTERDLEVLIVGDGVAAEVREVAEGLVAKDPRVRFFDFPKAPHHGEIHRHTAIQQSLGDVIAYLCDDDLLMPEHIADMCHLLRTHDFVQSLNGQFDPDGVMHHYAGDLANPDWIARLCDFSRDYNFVSITGTAHTRAFYDRVDAPWETTPEGIFPDRYQWGRMLRTGARGATSGRMTALSFPTHQDGRENWTSEQRAAEVERWAKLVRGPGAQAEIDRRVTAASARELVTVTGMALHLQEQLADAERRLSTVTDSRWWKLGRRLRPRLQGRER